MKDNRKAYEETFDTQLQSLGKPEDRSRKGLDEVKSDYPPRNLNVQRGRRLVPVADRHARILAEAVILQSIEDLWNPVCKRESLLFFEGDGFELCSEIAGIGYIKQLAMLRMLADSGPKTNLHNIRKAL